MGRPGGRAREIQVRMIHVFLFIIYLFYLLFFVSKIKLLILCYTPVSGAAVPDMTVFK